MLRPLLLRSLRLRVRLLLRRIRLRAGLRLLWGSLLGGSPS